MDMRDLAAAAPLEQHGRNPRFLLEFRVAAFLGVRPADRAKLPENAFAALRRQVTEIIQRDVDDTTWHPVPRLPRQNPQALPGDTPYPGMIPAPAGVWPRRAG